MMGYQQGAFALGYVGDQTDPLAFLRGTDAKTKLVADFADNADAFRTFVDELLAAIPEIAFSPAGPTSSVTATNSAISLVLLLR